MNAIPFFFCMQIISSMPLSVRYVWNSIAYIFVTNQFQFLLSKEESSHNLPGMENRTPAVYLICTFQLPDSCMFCHRSLCTLAVVSHAFPHHS
jgi:hypothetical protein